MLTPMGRAAFAKFLDRRGLIVVNVNRAVDIVQLLRWSKRNNVRVAVTGGAEAWKVADQLAAAKVPVFVDTLADLPADFDQLGATLENAARLHNAGVEVAIQSAGSHHARKVRQMAGNAVANGLPWEDGLAALTRVPAQVFGVDGEVGTIAVGKRADLVLWSGDPLDVTALAEAVWLDGRAQPMRSRQTELRDRYLHSPNGLPRAYPAGSD
jgi:imidazolonepropionase-like amidohydrolase